MTKRFAIFLGRGLTTSSGDWRELAFYFADLVTALKCGQFRSFTASLLI